jgi:hypothetical protein
MAAGTSTTGLLPTFELGAQGRSEVERGPNVSAGLSLAYTPIRAELMSDTSQVLFRTPLLELRFSVGLSWRGL